MREWHKPMIEETEVGCGGHELPAGRAGSRLIQHFSSRKFAKRDQAKARSPFRLSGVRRKGRRGVAPSPRFGYDGSTHCAESAFQVFLIRHQRSVHERVMKISFGLTMFQHGITESQGAIEKRD
jgi:hypothetical protein